jgi:hypothetical protein
VDPDGEPIQRTANSQYPWKGYEPAKPIAWKARVRLCARYRRLAAIGKPKFVVTTGSRARWSASSGRPPALRSLKSSDEAAETEPTKGGRKFQVRLLEAGPRWGTLVPVMSLSPDDARL